MPYLQSYRYRGDPGLFGTLGGIFKTVGGILPGPVGGIARGIGGILRPTATVSVARPYQGMPQVPALPVPGVRGAVQRALPGGASGYMSQGIPRGYRPNKSGYFTKDGQYHPPGSKLVRVRRRNPANARALRRALSRAEGFGGIVKRVRKTTRRLRTL